MEGQAVFEAGDVVPPAAAGFVGQVEADAQVGTHHEHVHVEADAQPGAHGQFLEEVFHLEFAVGAERLVVVVDLQQPDVAGIDKHGSLEVSQYGESVFPVGLELERARLVEVAVRVAGLGMETTGADGAHGEGAHRVGAADVELLAVGHAERVAGADGGSDEDAPHDFVLTEQSPGPYQLRLGLDELRERRAHHRLAVAASHHVPHPGEHVAGLGHGAAPGDVVGAEIVVVGVGVCHFWDEHIVETQQQHRVHDQRGGKGVGDVEQLVVGEFERREFVERVLVGVPFPGHAATQLQHLEEARAVHQIGFEVEACPVQESPAPVDEFGCQQSWHGEGGLDAHLVGVEVGVLDAAALAGLPLVGAVQVEVEALAAAEEVVVSQSELEGGSDEGVALAGALHLELHLPGFVDHGDQVEVEDSVAIGEHGVARGGLHVDAAEDAHSRQGELGAVEAAHPEGAPRACEHVGVDHAGAQPHGFVPDDGHAVGDHGVDIGGGAAAGQHGGGDGAGQVAVLGLIGHIGRHDEPHVDHAALRHAVGQILDVLGAKVVVATVAQGVGDVDAHLVERVEAVAVAGAQIGMGAGQRVDDASLGVGGLEVTDGADAVGLGHVHIVGDARLLGALALVERVAGARGEVAVVAQQGVDHVDARGGLDALYGDRTCRKVLVEPAFEAFGVGVDAVVNPQPDGEGRSIVG